MIKNALISLFRPLVAAVAVVICGCAGCATKSSKQDDVAVPAPQLKHIDGSQPVSFQNMLCDVPVGTEVGKLYSGPFKTVLSKYTALGNGAIPDAPYIVKYINADLRDSGFTVVGGQNTLFAEDTLGKARYQLGGKLLSWTRNLYDARAGNRTDATAEVEWQLYDSFTRKIVFKELSSGKAQWTGIAPGVVAQAIRYSLRNLIADSDFISVLSKTNSPMSSPTFTNTLTISTVQPEHALSLPQDMDKVLDGVVVIRAGMVIGTGVIVSADGYTLTAAHVVSGVKEVQVVLKGGLQLIATVERVDPLDDVALIRIPGAGHHAVELNLGDKPAVGADLFVVGTPGSEQLASTVTKGIVSGYREIDGVKFIQTDASLSPGNSGGPFIDKSGKVVGICSRKVVRPGFEGLSFGVPMDGIAKDLGISWEPPK